MSVFVLSYWTRLFKFNLCFGHWEIAELRCPTEFLSFCLKVRKEPCFHLGANAHIYIYRSKCSQVFSFEKLNDAQLVQALCSLCLTLQDWCCLIMHYLISLLSAFISCYSALQRNTNICSYIILIKVLGCLTILR